MKIKPKMIIGAVIALLVVSWAWTAFKGKNSKKVTIEEVKPQRGNIQVLITTTGTVQPQNRLEMKPPINGRIEAILVKEGESVAKGQVVAWMSSTDRAALLDAARTKGEESIQYWEEAYKATPLIAPIDGEVIVRSVEPGQTVTSADPIVVLSDRLIVKAQVDETDIGRVKIGQKATVSLDAYPQEKVKAVIDHISYESKLINNVTIYEVDVLPQEVPAIFRSGMTANITVIEKEKEDVLLLPIEALRRQEDGTFVSAKPKGIGQAKLRRVELGIINDDHAEIISGAEADETFLIEHVKVAIPKKSPGGSPFMPSRQRNR